MLARIMQAWKRRGLPIGRRSLRFSQVSYSQFGEDLIAEATFGTAYRGGRYVDVGCFDPQKWSNTYRFYLKGWSGICVDPNSEFIKLWHKYRSRDTFVNVAVSSQSGEAAYTKSDDFPQENQLLLGARQQRPGAPTTVVRTERLDQIITKHHPAGEAIDFMSVDCEWHDLVVLQSNDFIRYRPRVLIVEDVDRRVDSPIDRFCGDAEYKLVGMSAQSKVFADERWLADRRSTVSNQ